jgi:type III secretory pathway lipoprotein EscJ
VFKFGEALSLNENISRHDRRDTGVEISILDARVKVSHNNLVELVKVLNFLLLPSMEDTNVEAVFNFKGFTVTKRDGIEISIG